MPCSAFSHAMQPCTCCMQHVGNLLFYVNVSNLHGAC
ncbi:hypothetical protein BALAC2494_02012 [Bifidobacterium animalis subsp. lactis CNCM I-2494]|uniref:Uncharacterized protein n=1 Tax=Bifidobacterium animalis subsp. lactis CNCM I-2494 TaxID=1042403 RepID=A0A806FUF6_BIFAN|nr:hypothetical protein BALAC2494_02012 [Bifidobacterium animalis subsp. lactis CNCM I-2494]